MSGALGCELMGGRYFEQHGRDNLPYALLVMLEEGLELTGVIVLIHALLMFIAQHAYDLQVRVESERTE